MQATIGTPTAIEMSLSCCQWVDPIPYNRLRIGVVKESASNEQRVALTPDSLSSLVKAGFSVIVEKDAGDKADFSDAAYEAVGAIISTKEEVWRSDIIVKVQPPSTAEVSLIHNSVLISLLYPTANKKLLEMLCSNKATVFALDCIPRLLSRGQTFDVLSSQANVAGYRAVVETTSVFGRQLTGQMTAAGKITPAKVLILGAGVAGLAAIGTAKSMGAMVSAYDVRAATAEQVESMGASFLRVTGASEDGSGSGGYAKEMSDAYKSAEAECVKRWVAAADIVITTALIPGRPAPRLITAEMVSGMQRGSVILDMAASQAGGNVELSQLDEVVTTNNGVKIIGYSNLPGRLASTSSTLFGNNVAKFILSCGPTTNLEVKGKFYPDYEDPVVRGMLVIDKGELRFPNDRPYSPPPPEPAPPVSKPLPQAMQVKEPEALVKKYSSNERAPFITTVIQLSLLSLVLYSVGLASDSPEFTSLVAVFLLSSFAGQQVVWGVVPALHSPLMAVTNAISGTTALGAMTLLGPNIFASNLSETLGAVALLLSFINIVGGFKISTKMLNLFRRKDEPLEFYELYSIPVFVSAGLITSSAVFGNAEVPVVEGSGAAVACIAGIGALASQKSARFGNALSIVGVSVGTISTIADLYIKNAANGITSFSTIALITVLATTGGIGGLVVADRVGPTELPQTVAGFHSLVGIAATLTAIGEYSVHGDSMDSGALLICALAAFIGSITSTGSIVAFAKLNGNLSSNALQLSGRDFINLGLFALCFIFGIHILSPDLLLRFFKPFSYLSGESSLVSIVLIAGLLGAHLTASIGGADMPVVITVLNSYSGWALCAEGFLLGNSLLTSIGALIGFSGAILTKIMCDAMNRNIVSVVFGGIGTSATNKKIAESGNDSSSSSSKSFHSIDISSASEALVNSKSVIIVPGYGLAVAKVQYIISEIYSDLRKKGILVRFAIHPVAGRMPGQLNILLAEAGVPYEAVLEMEEINEDFEHTDVTLVVGASDTVNSDAEDNPNSSIAGMPVLRVWKSNKVIAFKRSMSNKGYAGVENPLFYKDNTYMLLGDAKDTVQSLRDAIKKELMA